MNLSLYINNSEKNKLEKSLSDEFSMSGNLRNESSVVNPRIIVQADNPSKYNYAYIPEFNRYYFITDMTSVRTNIWELSMHVDVLMSFKESIKGTQIILSDTETTGQTNYMSGEQWVRNVKDTTEIINFPKYLPIKGEYILITAGGPGSEQS